MLKNSFPDGKSKKMAVYGWRYRARGNQRPPADTDWIVWLLLAGRGFGKTRTGAEMIVAEVRAKRAKRIALIGPTAADVRDVMVEGESGILSVAPPDSRPVYQVSKRRLVWQNGAVAFCYSADEPRRLRGPQHDLAWADEVSAWRFAQAAWDNLMLGLRLGNRPRIVVTTTPKPSRLLRDLIAAPSTRVTSGSTYANRDQLAATFISAIARRYEGTRLGRQEIHAELLEQADGALWSRAMIEAARIPRDAAAPPKRIVVAIDPAVTSGKGSDETGIIVASLGRDGLAYVLCDASGRFTADEWARRAVNLYAEYRADRIVGEVNNGGELIEILLRTVNPNVAYKAVTASKGKQTRAEPVAALYEQGRVRHAGGFPALEDQMCNWEPGGGESSPDRVDALVWAITELMLAEQSAGMIDFLAHEIERGKTAPAD